MTRVLFACVQNAGRWPFEDPVRPVEAPALTLARFRRVRDEIDEHIRAWLRQVGTLAVGPS